jgi:hypothetical protein
MSDYKYKDPSEHKFGHKYITGVIISPERISYKFETDSTILSYSAKPINVPRLTGTYIIAVAASSYETVYAIDMSIFPNHLTSADFKSQASNFSDTGNYEPNNTEETAVLINNPIMSYFHEGDIDYYLVKVE